MVRQRHLSRPAERRLPARSPRSMDFLRDKVAGYKRVRQVGQSDQEANGSALPRLPRIESQTLTPKVFAEGDSSAQHTMIHTKVESLDGEDRDDANRNQQNRNVKVEGSVSRGK